MSGETLEARIDRLEAVEAIKKLKHQYCAYCDDGYDPEGIASLFVEDAVWDAGEAFGRYEGRAAIKEFFRGVSKQIVFAAHLVVNERIEVDGDRARGDWCLIMPGTMIDDDGKRVAHWLSGVYDDRYVRIDGRWLFESLKVTIHFVKPHLEGWADA